MLAKIIYIKKNIGDTMVVYNSYTLPYIHDHCNTNGYDVFGHKIVLYNRDACVDVGDIFEFHNRYYSHEIFAEVYAVVRNPHETWCYTTVTGLLCCDGIPVNTFENTTYEPDRIDYGTPSGGLRDVMLYVGLEGSPVIGFGESVWPGRDMWFSFDILLESDFTGPFYGRAHPSYYLSNTLGSSATLYRTGIPGELRGTSRPVNVPHSAHNYYCFENELVAGYMRILLYDVTNIASYVRVTLSNICIRNVHDEIMPSGMCIPSYYSVLVHGP